MKRLSRLGGGPRGSPVTHERPVGGETQTGRSRSPARPTSLLKATNVQEGGASHVRLQAQGRAEHCTPARPAVITTTADDTTSSAPRGRGW